MISWVQDILGKVAVLDMYGGTTLLLQVLKAGYRGGDNELF